MSDRVLLLLLLLLPAATGGRWRRSGRRGPRSRTVGPGSGAPPRAGRRVPGQNSGRCRTLGRLRTGLRSDTVDFHIRQR